MKRREFDAIELGATLYVPATHKAIFTIANGEKFPDLKSAVFCLEDAIKERELPAAMANIEQMLQRKQHSDIKVFIRPRTVENLRELLHVKNIERIDGFALAKFSTMNMRDYFESLHQVRHHFHLMPVLESRDLFDANKLIAIREYLLEHEHSIVSLRIGGEDMFQYLGIKKDCHSSIHDFHVASKVLADLLSIFKPYEFNLSSTVYNCLENLEFFRAEVKRDVKEGFFGKTLIHPKQVAITNECYKVTEKELEEARLLTDDESDAIFRFEDKMCEVSAHRSWAEIILKRAEVYGVLKG